MSHTNYEVLGHFQCHADSQILVKIIILMQQERLIKQLIASAMGVFQDSFHPCHVPAFLVAGIYDSLPVLLNFLTGIVSIENM